MTINITMMVMMITMMLLVKIINNIRLLMVLSTAKAAATPKSRNFNYRKSTKDPPPTITKKVW